MTDYTPTWHIFKGNAEKPIYVGTSRDREAAEHLAKTKAQETHINHWVALIVSAFVATPELTHRAPLTLTPNF